MNNVWMAFKAEVIAQYQEQKQMADAALGSVDDATFFTHLQEDGDDHTNSIAILVKHLSGNFISRWTNFLTSDGEKVDRQRPREFLHEESDNRAQIMQRWEEGWRRLFATLEALTDELANQEQGSWISLSEDRGESWGAPIRVPVPFPGR